MNKQISLSNLEDELSQVRTKKKEFLEQIERIVPWNEWAAMIKPCYYKGERGNKPYDLELMLRLYLIQNLYNLADEATVAEVTDSRAFSDFCGVESSNQIPDGDTLGRFRNLLVKNELQEKLFEAGSYDFYFYSDGYLPAKRNITLAGIQTSSSAEMVVLSASEIVSAKFDIKELDIEQIKDLGIDTKDPSNRYVYEIKMDIVSEKTDATVSGDTILRDFHVTVNQDGEFLDISGNKDFKKSYKIENESKTSTDQGTITRRTQVTTLKTGLDQISGNQGTSYPDTVTPIKTLVCLSVTEYSWLKDFYNVSISFTNNSPEGFDIIDPKAELIIPDGLELGDSSVSMIKTMPTVSGGNTVTVSWLVKGKTQGTHNVSVNFTGTLTPFDVPITAVFSDTITVSVKDSLVFDIYENRYGVSKFTLTNASSLDEDKYNNTLYDVCVTMKDKEEFNDAEYIVLKYPSGLIEKIEWADDSKSETKSTVYLPVTVSHNVDLVSLRTLEKGQKIEGVIYYSFREIDD